MLFIIKSVTLTTITFLPFAEFSSSSNRGGGYFYLFDEELFYQWVVLCLLNHGLVYKTRCSTGIDPCFKSNGFVNFYSFYQLSITWMFHVVLFSFHSIYYSSPFSSLIHCYVLLISIVHRFCPFLSFQFNLFTLFHYFYCRFALVFLFSII